jgi:type II secretory pathway pseudopilin PulG
MDATTRQPNGGAAQAGFTLVEALVAVVVLVFGLMAVTNLMLVAASSNSVANQGTGAVTSATRAMDTLKGVTYTDLFEGGTDFDPADGGRECTDPALTFDEWHCTDTLPGVGTVHTHWWITATDDPRLLHVRVRSEGMGALSAARSRAEFTSFRACTNSTTAGGCPGAP